MVHQPYKRIVPNAQGAVVLIHGILSTPRHFDFLLDTIPENWSVYAILLDGHGGTVKDFSRTSYRAWQTQTDRLIRDLSARYPRILIGAHSLGTLLAIGQAVHNPGNICGLFLLQPPLRIRVSPKAALYCALAPFGIIPAGAKEMLADASITLSPRLWEYLGWIPRFAELLSASRTTRALLAQLHIPCRAYPARLDEMVSLKTCRDLKKHPRLSVTVLPHSGHYAYHEPDKSTLLHDFSEFIQQFQ